MILALGARKNFLSPFLTLHIYRAQGAERRHRRRLPPQHHEATFPLARSKKFGSIKNSRGCHMILTLIFQVNFEQISGNGQVKIFWGKSSNVSRVEHHLRLRLRRLPAPSQAIHLFWNHYLSRVFLSSRIFWVQGHEKF